MLILKNLPIFRGFISNARLSQIANLIGFNISTHPFTYLGVPIHKGKPKYVYLQPIAEKIKTKLSAWKSSLSFECEDFSSFVL